MAVVHAIMNAMIALSEQEMIAAQKNRRQLKLQWATLFLLQEEHFLLGYLSSGSFQKATGRTALPPFFTRTSIKGGPQCGTVNNKLLPALSACKWPVMAQGSTSRYLCCSSALPASWNRYTPFDNAFIIPYHTIPYHDTTVAPTSKKTHTITTNDANIFLRGWVSLRIALFTS
jgi:hypothetical protein